MYCEGTIMGKSRVKFMILSHVTLAPPVRYHIHQSHTATLQPKRHTTKTMLRKAALPMASF